MREKKNPKGLPLQVCLWKKTEYSDFRITLLVVNNSFNNWDYITLADVYEHYFEDFIIYLLVNWTAQDFRKHDGGIGMSH